VSESGDRVVRVMPSRVEPIPAAPLGGERPRHYTQIGISRRDPNLRRRPDRQDPRPAALLALPQGPRLASVLASVARARERDKRADSARSVTEAGKHTALMQAPAYRPEAGAPRTGTRALASGRGRAPGERSGVLAGSDGYGPDRRPASGEYEDWAPARGRDPLSFSRVPKEREVVVAPSLPSSVASAEPPIRRSPSEDPERPAGDRVGLSLF
jgi:hypothetical protein